MASSGTGNLSACHLLGVTVASALYSVYVLAFGASIHFLFNVRGRRVQPNKIILAVSVIIFLIITAQWCIYIVYIYTGFVIHGGTANGVLAFFSGISMLQVAQLYLFSMTGALLDSVLVYRMHIVWGRRWPLVVLPCTCIAAYMVSAVMLVQTCIHISQSLRHPSQFIEVLHEVQTLRSDTIIGLSLAVFANSFCSAMIIVRILLNSRAIKKAGARSFTGPTIHLLFESAAIVCACLVILLATFLLNNSGSYFMLIITPIIAGLSYSAIIVRVGLGIAERGSGGSRSLSNAQNTSSLFSSRPRECAHANPLSISVDQETSVSGDDGRRGNASGASVRSDDPEICRKTADWQTRPDKRPKS